MRFIVMGKGTIAVECLRAILETPGVDVPMVVGHSDDDGQDGWQKSLRAFCEKQALQFACPSNPNAPDFVAKVDGLSPDYTVSFQYAKILKQAFISVPSDGTLNLHFGPLPRYRGVSTIAWALANGEASTGVTIHFVDTGVDTGDIIAQRTVPIADSDNARSLYEKCVSAGIQLFKSLLPQILQKTLLATPQDNTQALYYPLGSFDFSAKGVNWKNSTKQLTSWMRSMIFPPYQYPEFDCQGQGVGIAEIGWDFQKSKRETPGTITEISAHGIRVATNDSYIDIRTVVVDGSVVSAADAGLKLGLKPGMVLPSSTRKKGAS